MCMCLYVCVYVHTYADIVCTYNMCAFIYVCMYTGWVRRLFVRARGQCSDFIVTNSSRESHKCGIHLADDAG